MCRELVAHLRPTITEQHRDDELVEVAVHRQERVLQRAEVIAPVRCVKVGEGLDGGDGVVPLATVELVDLAKVTDVFEDE